LCSCQQPSECYSKFTFARSLIFKFAFIQHPLPHTPNFSLPICWAPCPARQQAAVLRPCSHANKFLMSWYIDDLQQSASLQTSVL
jgi:hypothetical protein